MKLGYILIILVCCGACDRSGTSTTVAEAPVSDSLTISKELIEENREQHQCFDHNELAAKNIEFRKLEEETWLLKYEDNNPKTAQVKGCVYYGSIECIADERVNVDSVRLQLEEGTQLIKVDFEHLHGVENFDRPDISFRDCNFDGIEDMIYATYYSSGGKNVLQGYFLFNPSSDQFEYSDQLSNLSNVAFDDSSKTINSTWYGGHAGFIHGGGVYRFEGDSLITIASEEIDYDAESDSYFEIITTRNPDGSVDSVVNKVDPDD